MPKDYLFKKCDSRTVIYFLFSSVGLPEIPQHFFVEANVDLDWAKVQSMAEDEYDEFDELEKIFVSERKGPELSDEELLNTLDG
jgi:hypothetical protein